MPLHVTDAIKIAGMSPSMEFVPASALMRGRAVHRAIELIEAGRLDADSVHPEVAPRLASWLTWRRAAGLVVLQTELRIKGNGYVGTLDILGEMQGRRYVLDVKGGAPEPWHAIQTALYAMGVGPDVRRGAVYLDALGGIASFVPHQNPADFALASAVVAVATWKIANGLAIYDERA